MKYKIVFRGHVGKEIARLPSDIRVKVKIALRSLESMPFPDGCKKIHGCENYFRIKVGRQYRIVYEVVKHVCIITVVKVGHRKDVYRMLR